MGPWLSPLSQTLRREERKLETAPTGSGTLSLPFGGCPRTGVASLPFALPSPIQLQSLQRAGPGGRRVKMTPWGGAASPSPNPSPGPSG